MLSFIKNNLFFIVLGVAVVLFLFIFNEKSDQAKGIEVKPIETPIKDNTSQAEETTIAYVDIKGEVNNPGVYEVSSKARVEEVIQIAGGFTKQADQTVINMAQKVHDEMVVVVPKIGESPIISGVDTATNPQKINLNHASQEEIEQLNGIGPAKAQAIIQYREEKGYFQSIEDVLNVPGIGEKTLENLKDFIQVP